MREKMGQSRVFVFAFYMVFGLAAMLIVLTVHVSQAIAIEKKVLLIVNGKCYEGPCCDDSTLDRYEVEYKYRLEKAGFIVFPMAWDAIDPSINLSDYAFVYWNDYTGGGINDPYAPILIDALVAQKVPFMTPNPKFAILWDLATSNGPNMYGDTEWLRETYIEPLEVHSKLFDSLYLNSFPLQLGDRIQISRDSGDSPYIGVLADDATLSPDAIKIASAYDKVMGKYDLAIVMFPPGARQPNAAYGHNPPTAPFIHLGIGDEVPDVNPYCPSMSMAEYANDHENFWVIFTNAAKYLANAKDDDCAGGDDTTGCPTECSEEDSGALDIEGIKGKVGNEVRIPIRVQSAPNAGTSLGFEVTYDASVLEYSDFERGDLVTTFTMFDVNPSGPGKVRVAGLDTGNGISQGKTGYVLYLKFTVIGGQERECYPLQLETLKDHIASFPKTGGCFCISSCNADLNGDGEITPLDALTAFKCYLGSGPCSDCTDVNQDGEITPLDALCLFKIFLGQPSCLD